jgi:hypothetical protein
MADVKVSCQELLVEFKARKEEGRIPGASLFDESYVLEFASFVVERMTEILFKPLREPSEGLRELLGWLDNKQIEYDLVTEHEIGVPAVGHHGRAARLLRFFHAQWSRQRAEIGALGRLDAAFKRDPILQVVVGPYMLGRGGVAVSASSRYDRPRSDLVAATVCQGIVSVLDALEGKVPRG